MNQDTVVSWSDGSPFNGFLLLGLVLPINVTAWAELDLAGQYPGERLPIFTRIPITSGQFSKDAGVIYSTSINPPNTKYAAFYYDSSAYPPRQIAADPTLFSVTSTPITLVPPTLTAPTAGTVAPTPDA